MPAPRGWRSATCSTARFFRRIDVSPRHMASMRSRSETSIGELADSGHRAFVDPLTRVIKQQSRRFA